MGRRNGGFFGAEQQNCPSNQTKQRIANLQGEHAQRQAEVPVHWVDFNQSAKATTQGSDYEHNKPRRLVTCLFIWHLSLHRLDSVHLWLLGKI